MLEDRRRGGEIWCNKCDDDGCHPAAPCSKDRKERKREGKGKEGKGKEKESKQAS